MQFISWNVNGLRAAVRKGFMEHFEQLNADFFCLQEIKMMKEQADFSFDGYTEYWHSADRKGYSGTAIFAKQPANAVQYDIGNEQFAGEGRVISLFYDSFILVNVYTPNSQAKLKRIEYRQDWEDQFRTYVKELEQTAPVIICGDLNVSHKPIDLARPKENDGTAGYSQQERDKIQQLLDAGFTDTYRHFYPDKTGAYTWWTYRSPKARANNVGWRLDYFLVSDALVPELVEATIYPDITGSDHCPVGLKIF